MFLQLTGSVTKDLAIPGQDYGFEQLVMAQALGDGRALLERSYPISRLHLRNRKVGIDQLLETAIKL